MKSFPLASFLQHDPRQSVDEPFLASDHQPVPKAAVDASCLRLYRLFLGIFGVANLILGVICISLVAHVRHMSPVIEEVYSPAISAIQYKNIVFTSGFGQERTEYQGPPTPERNALWDDLYGFGISRIPRDAAAKLINKTVPLPGEEGSYVIELNVFHQLHCLNMLRKSLYDKTEYPPDHELMGIEHLEHCYDAIRQSLMCASDITPLPWVWVESEHESKEVARVLHTCRDFEAVKDWAKERKVIHFDRTIYVPNDLV